MKITIQLPITGVQYSNRFAELNGDECTSENILKAFTLLKCVDDTYHQKPTLPATAPENPMLVVENQQLKRSQERSQEFMNVFKYKYPELYTEIATMVDEVAKDIAANAAVDDKILDSIS